MYGLAQPSMAQASPATPNAYATAMSPASLPVNDISTPNNDAELRALLQRGASTIQGLTGSAHQGYSDALYNAISTYAQANPQSAIAGNALSAARQNAPAGHSFPGVAGPASPATTQPAQPATFAGTAASPPAIGPNPITPTPAAQPATLSGLAGGANSIIPLYKTNYIPEIPRGPKSLNVGAGYQPLAN